MLNSKQSVVTKLSTILTTYYELADEPKTTPCITYSESGGSALQLGDTLEYYNVVYTVKIWDRSVQTISEKAVLVDTAMKELGFKLTGSNELTQGGLICKILNYSGIGQDGTAAWL